MCDIEVPQDAETLHVMTERRSFSSSLLPPADPKANYLAHKDEIDQAIRHVLDGGSYILGPEVATFEQEFVRYLGVRFAVGVGSGTDALQLALRACGVGPGGPVPKFVEKAKRAYSLGGSTTRPPDEPGGQTEEEYAHGTVYSKSAGEESAIGVESGDRGALGPGSLDRGPAGEDPGCLGHAV